MSYHMDAEKISLDDLRKRIETTDLVPSRTSLLSELDSKIGILKGHNVGTLADLRAEMKTSKRLETLSEATGIDKNYLVLLRREIESYFPKPFLLKKLDWFSVAEIEKLEKKGIRNTADFYKAFIDANNRDELVESTKAESGIIDELIQLCDLMRMQWTSPTAAKMLVDAGYTNVEKVASAKDSRKNNLTN